MKRFVVDAFSARIEAPKALYVSESCQLSLEYTKAVTNQHHVSFFRQKRASIINVEQARILKSLDLKSAKK